MPPEQVKRPTSLGEQITLLRSRGMEVDDALGAQWLRNVSYYRLSGYWYSYRALPASGDPKRSRRLDSFVEGTSFADIAALYEFDRKMRTLIHDGMERIEVALRARVGELLVESGPLAHENPAIFREEFDHAAWLARAKSRLERAQRSNPAIAHYAENYSGFPFWVLAEVLDFSDMSLLYDGLRRQDQLRISSGFGFDVDVAALSAKQKKAYYRQDPLARWCEQLTILRNACAHHGRLWNRRFTPASTNAFRTIGGLASLPRGQSERLYGSLLVMAFLLRSISPGSSWADKVVRLVREHFLPIAGRTVSELGFPTEGLDALAAVGHLRHA